MIKALIVFALSNFTLTFLVTGLAFAAVGIARSPKPRSNALVVEKVLFWFLFWTIGVSNLYNFVFHVFFGRMAADFIGWADSPFQLEVGMASLGFAAVGFFAAFRGFDVRVAAVMGPGLFTLGDAAGHIHQMIAAHNFAPGNAGVIFYSDILLPLAGFLLLWLQRKAGRPESRRPAVATA